MAGCNGSLCFHGAFAKKTDAEAKAKKRRGAFILKKFAGRGRRSFRYIVATADTSTDFNFGASAPKRSRKKRAKR